jgi:hypothetical protein
MTKMSTIAKTEFALIPIFKGLNLKNFLFPAPLEEFREKARLKALSGLKLFRFGNSNLIRNFS